MTTINSAEFGEICDGVWRDRAGILEGRGILSGEAALIRAVYWRLCKAGVLPLPRNETDSPNHTILTYQLVVGCMLELNAHPPFDGAPLLNKLVLRYQTEHRAAPTRNEGPLLSPAFP